MNERKSSPLRNRPAEPFVSVVIPAYNARPLIDVQLEALARQTYGGPMEVLVSDNGSTDGLKDHLAQHPLKDHLDLSCVDASGRRGGVSPGEWWESAEASGRVRSEALLTREMLAQPVRAATSLPSATRTIWSIRNGLNH